MKTREDVMVEEPEAGAARPGRSVWIVLAVLAFVWLSVTAGALLSRMLDSAPTAGLGAVRTACDDSRSDSGG